MIKGIKTLLKKCVIKAAIPSGFYFQQEGHCPCCDTDVIFKANNSWLRDSFLCSNCSCIPRERALMLTIEKQYPNWKDLKIHESSPCSRGASVRLKKFCTAYVSSQYYPDQPFGSLIDDNHNEDLENQTFEDNSFDLVITQDVMEHVYHPEKAFGEIARTLKKGGAHIFTVPIINRHHPTEVWATKDENGNPLFSKTEEYHGNPVDPKGSPVTMHWGFDIVNFILTQSDLQTTVEDIDDLHFGIRAEFNEVLVSRKTI